MMNYKVIHIENWHRKEQYEFFRQFDEPFTGVVVDVNVTSLYNHCKDTGTSFFQMYLHLCLKAVNETPAFSLRIVEEQVRSYDKVHASAVIIRPDRSFGFSHIEFSEDFAVFSNNVESEKERIAHDRSLFPPVNTPDVIHFSAMPWIKFRGLSHARNLSVKDSCPKISVGKIFEQEDDLLMPLSVHVHHALADGIDMGEFIENYQRQLILN